MTSDSDANNHARWLSSGDPVLFEKIVRHYQGPVFGFLARMGVRASDAEDQAQEIFLRLWTARDRYDPEQAGLSTWLWTIARNVSLNHLSQKQHQQRHISDQRDADIANSLPAEDQSAGPDATFDHREELRAVDRAMAHLSTTDRLALSLVYAQELSMAEAARLCECSDGAFRVRLSRARGRLLELLNEKHQVNHANE